MNAAIHTSDPRHFKRLWREHGGSIDPQRGTGEVRYSHPRFVGTVRANDRRHDVPAVLLSRLNQILRFPAAAATDRQGRRDGGTASRGSK
jgi:hypothetical protein